MTTTSKAATKNTQQLLVANLNIVANAIQNKTKIGRGASNKLNLYGIKKIRQLILDLAVRGLLVPQDNSDEPASVLLEKIEPEKKSILTKGKFQSLEKKVPINNQNLFQIPENWEWCRLDDIAAIARGGSPRPIKEFITNSSNGLNWIKISDTDRSSRFIYNTAQKITEDGLSKTRVVYPGDLILSNSMSFGFPYILKIEGCIHDGWLVIRPPKKLLNKMYLCYLFLSAHSKKMFQDLASGAVVKNLNADKVRMLTIPLPPLAEQQRIVAKVDELMALCDQLEQQQQDSITTHNTLVTTLLNALTNANNKQQFNNTWTTITDNFALLFTTEQSIDELKQCILQLAVMGKLVVQDANDEPASVLLEKIATEKAELIKQGKIKKQKSLPVISEDEKPFAIPDSWQWVRFSNICNYKFGKTPPTKNPAYWDNENNGIPWVSIADMQHLQKLKKTNKFISERAVTEIFKGLPINSGTLLMSFKLTIGKISELDIDAYHNEAIISIFPFNKIKNNFISYFLPKRAQNSSLKQAIKGNTLNSDSISKILFPLPPLAEQQRIVAKVDELMAICDNLKQALAESQQLQLNLADATVEQIF